MPEPDPFSAIKTPWDSATPASGSVTGGPGGSSVPVPDHTLLRRVGQGAYGEVWLARNAIGQFRAVKIIHRRAFDSDRPFEREMAGIQRFEPVSRRHESQLNILHVGRGPDYFYYVMELADDQSSVIGHQSSAASDQATVPAADSSPTTVLNPDTYSPRTLRSELLFRGRLPVDECIRLGLALTTALEHLHRHGLVHRDIKPSNIVFVNGIPKLADIGLVAQAERTMSFVGTEGYLPPEGPGSVQADLFSLGRVLYEISTGHDRQQFPELPTNVVELPDRAALAEFNEVLVRACAPDVKQRYQTAAEMHADLALLQSGKSVARSRWVERRLKFVARAGAVVTAIAAVAAVAFLYQQAQTREARRLASENQTLAKAKSQLAADKSKLADENREQLVRLRVANGVRQLDEGDPAAAMLWFADALPLVTNNAAETSIHRIRIQQTLSQLPRPVQFLTHDEGVKWLGFSPDGKRFVTSTEAGWVHVWDAHTGAPLLKPLQLNGDAIREVRFTPDGQRLLMRTQSSKGPRVLTAAILDAVTGQTVFSKVATNLSRMSFSSDGRWLATARLDHVIEVLDIRDESRLLATLKGHTQEVRRLTVNSNVLLSASADQPLRLWRLPSGEPIGVPLPEQDLQHVQLPPFLSHDGQLLAIREETKQVDVTNIRIWRTDTLTWVGQPIESRGVSGIVSFLDSNGGWRLLDTFGGRIRVLDVATQANLFPPTQTGHQNEHRGIYDVSRDDRRIIQGRSGGIDGVWSLETGEMLAPPFQHGRQIMDVAISPDGSQCATLTDDGTCTLWNMNPRPQDAIYRFNADIPNIPDGAPQSLLKRFSPDRRRFLNRLRDGTVRLVDVERMAEQEMPGSRPATVASGHCIFAPDNRQWAIAYVASEEQGSVVVELWREEGGRLRSQILPHAKGIQNSSFAPRRAIVQSWYSDIGGYRYTKGLRPQDVRMLRFAPGGQSLITVSEDRQIRTWRTADGVLEHSVTAPETIQEAGDLFPDGRTLFVLARDTGFALFDLVTGSLTPVAVGSGSVTALAFDSAGGRFATVTEQQWGRVWNTRTGTPLSPPVRHDGLLTWADWSPDGKRIAMAGATSEVRVGDAATGELSLPPLRLGDQPLGTVTWSLDGRFLVARSNEKSVRVWDSVTGEAVTPLLKHNGDVRLAHLVANNRLITLSPPNVLRAWDLTETRLPIDVIADYAKLVAGRKLNAGGVLVPLKANELAELNRSLRARAPQLFE